MNCRCGAAALYRVGDVRYCAEHSEAGVRQVLARLPKRQFKRRYELGEGFPWVLGTGVPYTDICFSQQPRGMARVHLNWPQELWSPELPKYRLVLERVDE